MSQRELSVALSDQHLKRLSQCPPIEAISELIWNSLDAGSTNIWVDIHKTTTDGVEKIIIEDNGNGIESQTLDNAFGSLGLSPKSISNTNSRGKVVHGKLGEGRFRAYSLGNRVEWLSKDKSKKIVKIKGELEKPRSFFIEPSAEKIKSTSGTKFTAYNGYGDKLRIPSTEAVVNKLIGIFAPKLLAEPDIKIFVDGTTLDPQTDIQAQTLITLNKPFSQSKVKVVVWKKVAVRELVWADSNFNSRGTETLKLSSPGNYSIYIGSPNVEKAIDENTFGLREATELVDLKEESLKAAEKFILQQLKQKVSQTIDSLKEKHIYPYEGLPKTDLEKLERKVFDVCASHVIESIPTIATGNQDQQKLTFQLLKTAIETSPDSVQMVFEKVLKLPKAEIEELSSLLNRVNLTGLIKIGKTVSNRLDFISAFHQLVSDKEWKKHVLERTQLHKMLEQETWVFGEQFALGTSDETLNDVLKYHQNLLGHGNDEVQLEEDKRMVKIPDLVFGRQFKSGAGDIYEHLVVELKRPSVPIGTKEKSQIEAYATTIWNKSGFDKTKTSWNFIVISTEIEESVLPLLNPQDGSISTSDPSRLKIYVKTWDSIIQASKGRMEYLKEKLEFQSSKEEGFKYMKGKFPNILKDIEDSKTQAANKKNLAKKKSTKKKKK